MQLALFELLKDIQSAFNQMRDTRLSGNYKSTYELASALGGFMNAQPESKLASAPPFTTEIFDDADITDWDINGFTTVKDSEGNEIAYFQYAEDAEAFTTIGQIAAPVKPEDKKAEVIAAFKADHKKFKWKDKSGRDMKATLTGKDIREGENDRSWDDVKLKTWAKEAEDGDEWENAANKYTCIKS